MKTKITIEVEVKCNDVYPSQIESHLKEIVERIIEASKSEKYNSDNKIIYKDWDQPKPAELYIDVETETF